MNPSHRIEPLECLRGCAALCVVAWHLLLGFAPTHSGLFPGAVPVPLIGRWWFAPFNGTGAVSFFFVLSGFVLPWRYFQSGELELISRGLLKRWPRLAGPCVLATVASCALFATGAYHHVEAGQISGSPWLLSFGFINPPPGFQGDFWAAFSQGAFWTFYEGDAFYDSSLWTMRPEIVGSVVVFAIAPVLRIARRRAARTGLVLVVGVVLVGAEQHVPQFLAGTLLARALSERTLRLPWPAALAMATIAFILFGFDGPVGVYDAVAYTGLTNYLLYPLVWVPASMLLITAVLGCREVQALLSGRIARWLGQVSFPIYLFHVPIIYSLGSWVYIRVALASNARLATAPAALSVVLATLIVATVAARFDRWWVRVINRVAQRPTARPIPAPVQ